MPNFNDGKSFIIAIDGFSSCGKSTLAKDLAQKLSFIYVDTGAMYRSVSLFFLSNHISVDTQADYSDLLDAQVEIEFRTNGGKRLTFLNGNNVEDQIRSPKVANVVSDVAANSSVRRFLVAQQRKMGATQSLVMDGRDIGSVVFPNAQVKFFVTADIDVRTKRRFDELKAKGVQTTMTEVKHNLSMRDEKDSNREDSPLVKVDDAIVIDTTDHTRESQMLLALEHVMSKF